MSVAVNNRIEERIKKYTDDGRIMLSMVNLIRQHNLTLTLFGRNHPNMNIKRQINAVYLNRSLVK